MTTTIMTRPAARGTETAANPEYACDRCHGWHTGPCPAITLTRQYDLAVRMAREADARIPQGRRARRTLQEMVPGHKRQPVLVLYRPVMVDSDGWCPLCESYTCDPANCPPAAAAATAPAPAPAMANAGWQCEVCGGRFGVTATPGPAVSWTCDACKSNGH